MDAAALRRCVPKRTVKPCGPVPSMLGSSCAKRFAQRRWLKSPIHRGERGVSRKAIAQGMPERFGLPDYLCAPLPFQHTSLRVRPAPGIPCVLRSSRMPVAGKLGRDRAARRNDRVLSSAAGRRGIAARINRTRLIRIGPCVGPISKRIGVALLLPDGSSIRSGLMVLWGCCRELHRRHQDDDRSQDDC
jgi:hypothetical protein